FVSSRRRHTRWPRDWSSDVCSSDLCLHVPSSGAEIFDPPNLGLNMSAPLEGTWRQVGNKKYFIVENFSAKPVKGAKIGFYGAGRSEERRVGKEWRCWSGG